MSAAGIVVKVASPLRYVVVLFGGAGRRPDVLEVAVGITAKLPSPRKY
jgi:hypothetical protein